MDSFAMCYPGATVTRGSLSRSTDTAHFCRCWKSYWTALPTTGVLEQPGMLADFSHQWELHLKASGNMWRSVKNQVERNCHQFVAVGGPSPRPRGCPGAVLLKPEVCGRTAGELRVQRQTLVGWSGAWVISTPWRCCCLGLGSDDWRSTDPQHWFPVLAACHNPLGSKHPWDLELNPRGSILTCLVCNLGTEDFKKLIKIWEPLMEVRQVY